jgi:hypothetical protein
MTEVQRVLLICALSRLHARADDYVCNAIERSADKEYAPHVEAVYELHSAIREVLFWRVGPGTGWPNNTLDGWIMDKLKDQGLYDAMTDELDYAKVDETRIAWINYMLENW